MSEMWAISVRQPWAWLIAQGYKDIENRTWATRYRGPLLIHAGLKPDPDLDWIRQIWAEETPPEPMPDTLPIGGIVGRVQLLDCVTSSDSDWFEGPFGFRLGDAEQLDFIPLRGRLGIFRVEIDANQLRI